MARKPTITGTEVEKGMQRAADENQEIKESMRPTRGMSADRLRDLLGLGDATITEVVTVDPPSNPVNGYLCCDGTKAVCCHACANNDARPFVEIADGKEHKCAKCGQPTNIYRVRAEYQRVRTLIIKHESNNNVAELPALKDRLYRIIQAFRMVGGNPYLLDEDPK
jgi:hypothetical protein